MVTEQSKENELLERQAAEYTAMVPTLRIRYKDQSRYWMVLPHRKRDRASLIGSTIWLPSKAWAKEDAWRVFVTIACAFQRLLNWRRNRAVVLLHFLFPQIWAVVAIVALTIFLVWQQWAEASVALGCLALLLLPWPSSTRARHQVKICSMELAAYYLRDGHIRPSERERIRAALCRNPYYRCHAIPSEQIVDSMIRNVTGPRWPEDLDAFAPTVGAMNEVGLICDEAREAFRWPRREEV